MLKMKAMARILYYSNIDTEELEKKLGQLQELGLSSEIRICYENGGRRTGFEIVANRYSDLSGIIDRITESGILLAKKVTSRSKVGDEWQVFTYLVTR